MHPLDCPIVDDCLHQGGACSDGSVFRVKRRAIASIEAVVCCREGKPNANATSKLFHGVGEIQGATSPLHSLILRYHSLQPRLIVFDGTTVNGQIEFISEYSGAASPDFGKECCSDKLNGLHCAEIMVHIDAKSNGQPEFIQGRIMTMLNRGDGVWRPEAEVKYEVRLAAV